MSFINITNIIIEDNPASFQSPLRLNISFEVLKEIPEEVHWELIYLGSAKDKKYDQVLDSFEMGPFSEVGTMQFVLESQAPDYTKIPSKDDILGITAIILTVSIKEKEFYRCGFYVYNSYTDEQLLENDTPDAPIQIEKVQRNILADKPRVTKFDVRFEDEEQQQQQQQLNVLQDGQNSLNQLLNFNNNSNLDAFNLNQKLGQNQQNINNKYQENNQNSQFAFNPFSNNLENISQNNLNIDLENRMGPSKMMGLNDVFSSNQNDKDQTIINNTINSNNFFANGMSNQKLDSNLIDSSLRNNNSQIASFF